MDTDFRPLYCMLPKKDRPGALCRHYLGDVEIGKSVRLRFTCPKHAGDPTNRIEFHIDGDSSAITCNPIKRSSPPEPEENEYERQLPDGIVITQ